MSRPALVLGPIGRIARLVAGALFAYWLGYCLVVPVTNIDSQMYDLARLELAFRGGLFGNGLFTSIYQLMWPWTFDAVHLPFLLLGFGYALPSFFCLVGTAAASFQLVRARFGADAAWTAVVALLGLTCLVYQGTSTKSDIAVVFAGAVWVYARWRRRQDGRPQHLFWMCLAIGFMAGAKTTGLIDGAVLAGITLWDLRRAPAWAARTCLGLVAAVLLFGSIETYAESARVFGHPMGPPATIRALRNRAGVRGALANLTRCLAGGVCLAPVSTAQGSAMGGAVVRAEQSLLAATGLTDAGTDARFPDHSLAYFQGGFEELTGFGPLGTLALAAGLGACLVWRPRERWWQLALVADAGLVVTCATVAYSPWGNRYLIGWFALGAVAVVALLWQRESRLWRLGRWAFLAVAAGSAVAAPLVSFNRSPAALLSCVRDRQAFETCANPITGRLRARLRALRAVSPSSTVYYVACQDSTILPILEDRQLDAVVTTPQEFILLLREGRVAPGDLEIEDTNLGLPGLQKIETVTAPDVFSSTGERSQAIYRVGGPGPKT